MLWVVEVIKWDLRRALCRKRKLLQFKATCTNVTYKPLKYHPDGSFLLHHTFSNCFQKARKEEMKDDRLGGSAKEVRLPRHLGRQLPAPGGRGGGTRAGGGSATPGEDRSPAGQCLGALSPTWGRPPGAGGRRSPREPSKGASAPSGGCTPALLLPPGPDGAARPGTLRNDGRRGAVERDGGAPGPKRGLGSPDGGWLGGEGQVTGPAGFCCRPGGTGGVRGADNSEPHGEACRGMRTPPSTSPTAVLGATGARQGSRRSGPALPSI
ncbi:Zinc finger protein ZIC 4 [Aix galericulata]|nr:Zinc finger protein ZIC 4 [Aix galericulata]